MSHYEIEIAKMESRTPLFYYPYQVESKTELAKKTLAIFFRDKFRYAGGIRPLTQQDFEFADEKMKLLSGRYTFHYDDPQETEGQRIAAVKHSVPISLGNQRVDGFNNYVPGVTTHRSHLIEGKDFEIIIGERVEIEQSVKLSFDDIPDLMGVESE